jgi:hypothetical protein
MSAIRLFRIAFYDNSPYGGYIAEDVVDIYYDPSTDADVNNLYTGLSVYLNGSLITSGNDIIPGIPAVFTQNNYTPLICKDGFSVFGLRQFSFPYVKKSIFNDPNSCQIGGGVCNLAFSPNITLTNPSSSSSIDGVIVVLATSNNPIKYKIGSDFDYNDGTGQSSGTFTSLITGSYRIYARDSQNCSANILVNLPFDTTYGVKYTIDYLNLAGHRSKIDILEKGYGGASSYIIMDGTPFTLDLRGEGVLDKFQPILASQANIYISSQTDLQFSELFTNDASKYKVNFYKDTSGGTSYTLQWSGFVVPQIYSEQYSNTPYVVTVQATDGLPNLGKVAFLHDDGNKFIGTIRAMSLLALALQKTNINLSIRCGCNLFANTMASTSSDDPLDQAYVDVDTYYLINDTPTWADVINAILKSFRARLVQGNGFWNIFRPEEMISSFNYREFDYTGNYLSNSSYNPVTEIKSAVSSNRLRWSEQNQNLEIRPGYGKLRVKYHLGYKSNILRNGDFGLISTFNSLSNGYNYSINLYGWQITSPTYPMTNSYSINTPSDINDISLILSGALGDVTKPYGYIQSDNYMLAMGSVNQIKFSINVKCPAPYVYGLAVDGSGNTVVIATTIKIPYQKIRARIYYGAKYLQNDGTWTNIPTDLIFYCTQFDQFVDFSIQANWPDPTYTIAKQFYVRVYHSTENDYDFTTSGQLKAKITNSNYGTHSARGNYDASTGVFPSSGGSGGAGAIVAGDRWTVNVQGSIYGVLCIVSTKITCINSTPGQDPENWLIGDLTIPTGTRTEVYGLSGIAGIAYYEFQNNTSAESIPSIIRPNDYDVTNNPNQWVLITSTNTPSQRPSIDFYINKVQVQYLVNGTSPFDALITEITGETNNLLAVEDDIFHASLEELMDSITTSVLVTNLRNGSPNPLVRDNPLDLSLSGQFPSNTTIFPNILKVQLIQNVLAGDIIYAGYYRDSSGVGYTDWTRNGISEANHLHAIWLSTTIAQYKRSWKKITGSLYGDVFMPLVNVLKDLDDTIYLPISLTFDDKNNSYNGEFLELTDINSSSGVTQPFSGGFSQTAFGSGFNI